ncbi:MAG: peptide ABC transporter substrate-binding protein [Planctomycetes bacterium]|nr:peptide ABC transporter substrate-binding protein [Planctomycetota bacterium]
MKVFPDHGARPRTGGVLAWVVGLPLFLFALGLALGLRGTRPRAELSFNNGTEPASLDPAVATGLPEGRVLRCLYEGLVVKHPRTLEPLPGMAERWHLSADRRVYTFELRTSRDGSISEDGSIGARWSNGAPVVAQDFVASWQRLLDPRTGSGYGKELWRVRGAREWSTTLDEQGAPRLPFDGVGLRARDERTLVVELDAPWASFLDLVSLPALLPVHVPTLEALRAAHPSDWQRRWLRPRELVTNGPFRVLEHRVNERLRLERNPDYWDAARVGLATLDVWALESPVTALNLYEAGELDLLTEVPATLVPRLLERPDFRPAPILGTYFYRFNTARPPLDDARVRRALALVLPREEIARNVAGAGEVPAWSFVPPGLADYAGALLGTGAAAADAATARELLAQAGYGPQGRPLPTLELSYNTQGRHREIAEVAAETWQRELGLRVALAGRETKTFLDSQRSRDYDISRSSWIGDWPDAANFLEIFASESENNRTGWADADYDALLARAAAAAPAERLELLARAEARLLDQAPLAPVFYYVSRNLVRPGLLGFEPNVLDEHPPKFWSWAR